MADMLMPTWFSMRGVIGSASFAISLTTTGIAWWMARRARLDRVDRKREQRLREELEAYTQLDAGLPHPPRTGVEEQSADKAFALRVCRMIAEKSAFKRVLMLLRDSEGRLRCVGSVGIDDLTVAAVERWGVQVVAEQRGGAPKGDSLLGRSGAKHVPISLGEWQNFDAEISSWKMSGKRERRQWRRAIVMPIRTSVVQGLGPVGGRVAGAIVVCPDGMADRSGGPAARVDRNLSGLESLAARLGTALENQTLGNRLLRAEKLAGLGQFAAGVAEALNQPITAVLGYAELIAETSSEARVRTDASQIAAEALKMLRTIEELAELAQPAVVEGERVDLLGLVREATAQCEPRLQEAGIALEVQVQEAVAPVRGSRTRLLYVLEHMLHHAARSIVEAGATVEGQEHAVRVALSQDEQTIYLVVSDTGRGFDEAAQVFDPILVPSHGAQTSVQTQALGLSSCYRIVREHGGEIAAYNLQPRGGAIAVELPIAPPGREQSLPVDVAVRMLA